MSSTLELRNTVIQMSVAMKPIYTVGSPMSHPLARMQRIDSVERVKGRMKLIARTIVCIPSTGQMIPGIENHTQIKNLSLGTYSKSKSVGIVQFF